MSLGMESDSESGDAGEVNYLDGILVPAPVVIPDAIIVAAPLQKEPVFNKPSARTKADHVGITALMREALERQRRVRAEAAKKKQKRCLQFAIARRATLVG